MSEYNEQLFVRVCTLEAELELTRKELYEAEQKIKELELLLRDAVKIVLQYNDKSHTNT